MQAFERFFKKKNEESAFPRFEISVCPYAAPDCSFVSHKADGKDNEQHRDIDCKLKHVLYDSCGYSGRIRGFGDKAVVQIERCIDEQIDDNDIKQSCDHDPYEHRDVLILHADRVNAELMVQADAVDKSLQTCYKRIRRQKAACGVYHESDNVARKSCKDRDCRSEQHTDDCDRDEREVQFSEPDVDRERFNKHRYGDKHACYRNALYAFEFFRRIDEHTKKALHKHTSLCEPSLCA